MEIASFPRDPGGTAYPRFFYCGIASKVKALFHKLKPHTIFLMFEPFQIEMDLVWLKKAAK